MDDDDRCHSKQKDHRDILGLEGSFHYIFELCGYAINRTSEFSSLTSDSAAPCGDARLLVAC